MCEAICLTQQEGLRNQPATRDRALDIGPISEPRLGRQPVLQRGGDPGGPRIAVHLAQIHSVPSGWPVTERREHQPRKRVARLPAQSGEVMKLGQQPYLGQRVLEPSSILRRRLRADGAPPPIPRVPGDARRRRLGKLVIAVPLSVEADVRSRLRPQPVHDTSADEQLGPILYRRCPPSVAGR